MPSESEMVHNLTMLNAIGETLNRAIDVREVLDTTLAQLVALMGLETGWIFLRDPASAERWCGSGYVLAAHHNLPPAMAPDNAEAWDHGCACQDLCQSEAQRVAYNEVQCSRLAGVRGDRRGLRVHASAPLRAGDRLLGILNVAGSEWGVFSPEALALLGNVANQMSIALERARLFDLVREQRVDEQAALLELSNQLLSRLDRDDLLAFLVSETRRLLAADACALLLAEEDPDCLAFAAADGWRVDPVAAGRCVSAGEAIEGDAGGAGRVMRTQQPLLAGDLQGGDAVAWLPEWMQAEGFRGHAAVPLIVEGRSLGVLLLNTRQPRQVDRDEVRFLRLVANQAALALEQARLRQEVLQRHRYEQELAVGRQIQLSLLPRGCPALAGWECAATYRPARIVGGDFYDFFELPLAGSGSRRRLGVVIADVADKGVPAALFMALSRTMIRTAALGGRRPAVALARASELIRNDSRSDLFVTACYGILDLDSGRLSYANGGHHPPLWFRNGTGEVHSLPGRGIALGVVQQAEIDEEEMEIAPGDLVVFYTDGVTEAMDGQRREFGDQQLRDVIRSHAPQGAHAVLDAVVASVAAHRGDAPQSDDLTLFVLQREP